MNETAVPDQNKANPPEEPSAEALMASFGKTESKTPGRMRMRLHPQMRTPEALAQIKANLEDHPDIEDVQINERTGSVVVKHHARHDSHKLFWEAVQEVDLLAEVVLEVPAEDESGESPEGKLDEQLARLVYGIDKKVYQLTGHQLHLGLAIPATFAGLGLAQMLLYGISMEMLPGPVLLWIAYDVYRRSNQEPPFVAYERNTAVAGSEATEEVAQGAAEEAEGGVAGTAVAVK
jgi:hypothetical protein